MQATKQPRSASQRLSLNALLMLLSVVALANTGCVKLISNMIYVIKGRDTPAEYDGFVDKRVAVLVSIDGVHSADANSFILAKNVNMLLQNKVKKVRMINQDEVDRLLQDQQLGNVDPPTFGGQLGADFIVDIDITDLKLYEGKTLYKGRCSATVTAYNCHDRKEPVFRKSFTDFTYPINGTPVTDLDEATFRRVYLMTLAERLSRVFYPYDPVTDVAQEAAMASAGM